MRPREKREREKGREGEREGKAEGEREGERAGAQGGGGRRRSGAPAPLHPSSSSRHPHRGGAGQCRRGLEQPRWSGPTLSGASRAGVALFLLPRLPSRPDPRATEVAAQLEIQRAATSGRRSRRGKEEAQPQGFLRRYPSPPPPPLYRPSPPPPRIVSAVIPSPAGRLQHRRSISSPSYRPLPPAVDGEREGAGSDCGGAGREREAGRVEEEERERRRGRAAAAASSSGGRSDGGADGGR